MTTKLKIVFVLLSVQLSGISGSRNFYEDYDDEIRIESNPRPPFWLKPKQMERRIFAEPLNSQV